MDYSGYYRQIAAAQERIRELRKEEEGLGEFLSEVRSASSAFTETLGRRRGLARSAQALADSRMARGFGSSYLSTIGPTFKERVSDDFASIRKDAKRALADVKREMGEQREAIRRAEDEMARIRRQEAQRAAEEAAQ